MASYVEIWDLRYGSATLKSRTVVAVATAAQDILVEDPAYANHAARVVWASRAIQDANAEAERFMWAVAGNTTIQSTGDACSDSDIQFVVNSNIDNFAVGA